MGLLLPYAPLLEAFVLLGNVDAAGIVFDVPAGDVALVAVDVCISIVADVTVPYGSRWLKLTFAS